MKRMLAILFLCLSAQSYANPFKVPTIWDHLMSEEQKRIQAEEEKKRSYFIGFSVGAGVMDISLPFLNPRIWKEVESVINSLDYILAIEGGWQKYTYERVGYRTIYRGRLSYISNLHAPIFPASTSRYKNGFTFEFSAGIDGIFDLLKNNQNSFGMLLGINGGMGIMFAKASRWIKASDATFAMEWFSNLRIGFQTGLPSGFIDLVFELPFVSVSFTQSPYNYAITLGYKHFF